MKGVPIPRQELVSFREENGLTIDGMARYFGVARATVCGWLYRHQHQRMDPVFYDRVMRKMKEKYTSPREMSATDVGLSSIESAIKGDTDNCWLHYASEIYASDVALEKRIIIAYTGVAATTLARWLNLIMPQGQNLLKLRCFLGHRGYGVAELDALSDMLKTIAYLIADKKIAITEVVRRTRYHQDGNLLQVLLGHTNMSGERLALCRDLIEEYVIDEEKKANDPIFIQIPKQEHAPAWIDHKKEHSFAMRVNGTQKWEVENLAAFVRMMLPLAEAVVSNEYTEQDRERLRTLANGDGVFRLSTALNGLCGPRMRTRVINKQEGE